MRAHFKREFALTLRAARDGEAEQNLRIHFRQIFWRAVSPAASKRVEAGMMQRASSKCGGAANSFQSISSFERFRFHGWFRFKLASVPRVLRVDLSGKHTHGWSGSVLSSLWKKIGSALVAVEVTRRCCGKGNHGLRRASDRPSCRSPTAGAEGLEWCGLPPRWSVRKREQALRAPNAAAGN